jgi:uncharacterized membrane protein YeaQ/YmgE (transglycosylase-associated protein family)
MGWLTRIVLGAITGLNLESILVPVFGAIAVIFLARAFTGGRATI